MSKIKVCDYLENSHLLSPDKGKELRKKVLDLLNRSESIILDFDGYEYISSSFVNEVLGKVLIEKKWTGEELKRRVKWENLSEDDETDFLISIENAETKLQLIQNNIDPDEFYRANIPAI